MYVNLDELRKSKKIKYYLSTHLTYFFYFLSSFYLFIQPFRILLHSFFKGIYKYIMKAMAIIFGWNMGYGHGLMDFSACLALCLCLPLMPSGLLGKMSFLLWIFSIVIAQGQIFFKRDIQTYKAIMHVCTALNRRTCLLKRNTMINNSKIFSSIICMFSKSACSHCSKTKLQTFHLVRYTLIHNQQQHHHHPDSDPRPTITIQSK